jgi:hypothetical protein
VRDVPVEFRASGDWNPFHLALSEYWDICSPSCFVMNSDHIWVPSACRICLLVCSDLFRSGPVAHLFHAIFCTTIVPAFIVTVDEILNRLIVQINCALLKTFSCFPINCAPLKHDIYVCRQCCSLMLFCRYHKYSDRPNDFVLKVQGDIAIQLFCLEVYVQHRCLLSVSFCNNGIALQYAHGTPN